MASLELCVFPDLRRLSSPSGVPKHIRRICEGLHARPDVHLSLLANRTELDAARAAARDPWLSARATVFEPSTRWLKASWSLLGGPTLEALGGRASWLYLPADSYVPTRLARLAGTVHDVYTLESPAPGESAVAHRCARLRLAPVYRRLARDAEVLFVVSRFTADRVMDVLGVPASRIHVVRNGVDPVFFDRAPGSSAAAVESRFALEAGQYVLHVGGLTPKKNARCLLEAWSASGLARKGISLVAVGNHRPEIAARALDTAGVVLPGEVSDADLADLYTACALVALPSWYEGFGIPVAEAMACGAPLLLADIPAFREVAGDCAGYLPAGDSEAWARRMSALVGDAQRRDADAEARRRASALRWEACVERVLEVLRCEDCG